MAKVKIVVKVTMKDDKKARKALRIAVGVSGVESAALEGSDKDKIALTGEGIDPVELTTLLRKGVGYTELVSVGRVEEKKPAAAASQTEATVVPIYYMNPYYNNSYDRPIFYDVSNYNDPCTIM